MLKIICVFMVLDFYSYCHGDSTLRDKGKLDFYRPRHNYPKRNQNDVRSYQLKDRQNSQSQILFWPMIKSRLERRYDHSTEQDQNVIDILSTERQNYTQNGNNFRKNNYRDFFEKENQNAIRSKSQYTFEKINDVSPQNWISISPKNKLTNQYINSARSRHGLKQNDKIKVFKESYSRFQTKYTPESQIVSDCCIVTSNVLFLHNSNSKPGRNGQNSFKAPDYLPPLDTTSTNYKAPEYLPPSSTTRRPYITNTINRHLFYTTSSTTTGNKYTITPYYIPSMNQRPVTKQNTKGPFYIPVTKPPVSTTVPNVFETNTYEMNEDDPARAMLVPAEDDDEMERVIPLPPKINGADNGQSREDVDLKADVPRDATTTNTYGSIDRVHERDDVPGEEYFTSVEPAVANILPSKDESTSKIYMILTTTEPTSTFTTSKTIDTSIFDTSTAIDKKSSTNYKAPKYLPPSSTTIRPYISNTINRHLFYTTSSTTTGNKYTITPYYIPSMNQRPVTKQNTKGPFYIPVTKPPVSTTVPNVFETNTYEMNEDDPAKAMLVPAEDDDEMERVIPLPPKINGADIGPSREDVDLKADVPRDATTTNTHGSIDRVHERGDVPGEEYFTSVQPAVANIVPSKDESTSKIYMILTTTEPTSTFTTSKTIGTSIFDTSTAIDKKTSTNYKAPEYLPPSSTTIRPYISNTINRHLFYTTSSTTTDNKYTITPYYIPSMNQRPVTKQNTKGPFYIPVTKPPVSTTVPNVFETNTYEMNEDDPARAMLVPAEDDDEMERVIPLPPKINGADIGPSREDVDLKADVPRDATTTNTHGSIDRVHERGDVPGEEYFTSVQPAVANILPSKDESTSKIYMILTTTEPTSTFTTSKTIDTSIFDTSTAIDKKTSTMPLLENNRHLTEETDATTLKFMTQLTESFRGQEYLPPENNTTSIPATIAQANPGPAPAMAMPVPPEPEDEENDVNDDEIMKKMAALPSTITTTPIISTSALSTTTTMPNQIATFQSTSPTAPTAFTGPEYLPPKTIAIPPVATASSGVAPAMAMPVPELEDDPTPPPKLTPTEASRASETSNTKPTVPTDTFKGPKYLPPKDMKPVVQPSPGITMPVPPQHDCNQNSSNSPDIDPRFADTDECLPRKPKPNKFTE